MKNQNLRICIGSSIALVLLALGGVFTWQCCFKITKIPISFDENFVPKIPIAIGDKKIPVSLYLRSKYPLVLEEDVLNGILKKKRGVETSQNVEGVVRENQLYEIDRVTFGNWKWKHTLTAENPSRSNGIEWPLEKANVLIDFPHRYVCHVREKEQLQKFGVDLSKMWKIPCRINNKGVFFSGEVDSKDFTFCLSTSTNFNCINQVLCSGSNDRMKRMASASGYFLGSYRFTPVAISPEFGADFILGADFFEDHIVYLDAQNREIYIGNPYCKLFIPGSNSIIPIELTKSGVPFIEVAHDKKKYKLILDLGASNEIILLKKYDGLAEQRIGTAFSSNMFGEISPSEVFLADNVRIGKSVFPNVLVGCTAKMGANVKMGYESMGKTNQKEMDGAIGYPLLSRSNFYLDIKRGILQFAKDITEIPIDPDNFERVNFEVSNYLVNVLVKTDLGEIKLLLDSGSPFSAIKEDLVFGKQLVRDNNSNWIYESSRFEMSSVDWGKQGFFPLPIHENFAQIDGILGGDFLRKRAVFFDNKEKELWIERNPRYTR